MTISLRFLVAVSIVGLSACASMHRVTRITPATAGERARLCDAAVFYALPQTAVMADIELTRQDYEPGRCGDAIIRTLRRSSS